MDSDYLGSLMYFMSLCDKITTQQEFGTLMNELTLAIGKKIMSKILFSGLTSIPNTCITTNKQNIISSIIKITENTMNIQCKPTPSTTKTIKHTHNIVHAQSINNIENIN
eukprot:445401_1